MLNDLEEKIKQLEKLLTEIRVMVTPKPVAPPASPPPPQFYDIKIGLKDLDYSDLENVEQSAAFLKEERRKEHVQKYSKHKHGRQTCPHCGNQYYIQFWNNTKEYRCLLCLHCWPAMDADLAWEDWNLKQRMAGVTTQ